MTVSTALAPGSVLADTYRIERVLGEGGMGLVVAAQHLHQHRRVAIKVLRDRPTGEMLARFRQQVEVASRLRHDNIVEVVELDVLPDGAAFLVMELLDGESLDVRLQRGALPADQVARITRQAAAGLAAAHAAGVIHRDLTPENIFLLQRDHVKIIDVGISQLAAQGTVIGTPHYMAPEQAMTGNDALDARADQFSLAVIAYEMLAGRVPFDGDAAPAVMFKLAYQEPPALATLAPATPKAMLAAIQRAMSKAPQDRFPDVSTFADALTA